MYCILVSGIPASGKTCLSKVIANQFDIPVISKDEIKEIMFDTIGFSNRQEKVQLGIVSMKAMYYFAKQLMESKKAFILENNFEEISMIDLNNLINHYNYKIVHVHVTGNYQVIYKRFIERDRSGHRHLGHVLNTRYPCQDLASYKEITYDEFLMSIKSRGMEDFKIVENRIVVDHTDFSKIDYQSILNRIRESIKN